MVGGKPTCFKYRHIYIYIYRESCVMIPKDERGLKPPRTLKRWPVLVGRGSRYVSDVDQIGSCLPMRMKEELGSLAQSSCRCLI